MRIAVPAETDPHETRIALMPEAASKLVKAGFTVRIEAGLGRDLRLDDERFTEVGCEVVEQRAELLADAEVVLRVRVDEQDISALPEGCLHVSFFDAFNHRELAEAAAAAKIRLASVEMIPRSTYAQKMDALSSQHSIAGYYMVVLAAERLGKVLPMMMTPAGTIQPARVFVIGAGVAGLQAIATAKRLGARVEAFDTRPVVEEQVRSLGARFVKIDLGDTGQTDQGYAKELTDEQKQKQLDGMAKVCAQSDIVITTAQLFGRPAPEVVNADMLAGMKPGAVVIDYAVESGGNVAGSRPGEEVEVDGVRVIGLRNYPGHVALDASRMYASNLVNFLTETWDGGEIVNPMIRKHYGLEELPPAEAEEASADEADADDADTGDGGSEATDEKEATS